MGATDLYERADRFYQERLRTELERSHLMELEQTMADAAKGVRDPRKMRASAERMDRMREENRRLFGQQEIGVEIIREMHRP